MYGRPSHLSIMRGESWLGWIIKRGEDRMLPRFDTSKIISFPQYFSAEVLITEMTKQINAQQKRLGKDKILNVILPVSDGRQMVVHTLEPLGHSGYMAEGFIDGIRSSLLGHISTLVLTCAIEESKGKGQGFIGFIEKPVTELPPESEPQS
jgi:hypothetical protein